MREGEGVKEGGWEDEVSKKARERERWEHTHTYNAGLLCELGGSDSTCTVVPRTLNI